MFLSSFLEVFRFQASVIHSSLSMFTGFATEEIEVLVAMRFENTHATL